MTPTFRNEVTFAIEPWGMYAREAPGLWEEHYAELEPAHRGRMLTVPDLSFYEAMERVGALQITVARRKGKMIGYCVVVVRPHVHYAKSICAFEDSYFVTKAERRGLVGYNLLKFAVESARARGAVRMYFQTKLFASIAKLLKRLGAEMIDECWGLWL